MGSFYLVRCIEKTINLIHLGRLKGFRSSSLHSQQRNRQPPRLTRPSPITVLPYAYHYSPVLNKALYLILYLLVEKVGVLAYLPLRYPQYVVTLQIRQSPVIRLRILNRVAVNTGEIRYDRENDVMDVSRQNQHLDRLSPSPAHREEHQNDENQNHLSHDSISPFPDGAADRPPHCLLIYLISFKAPHVRAALLTGVTAEMISNGTSNHSYVGGSVLLASCVCPLPLSLQESQ